MAKRLICVVLVLIMLAGVMILVPSSTIVRAEIITYDMQDLKLKCNPPLDEGYLSDWEYEDPSISVKIEKGRTEDTNYMTARVKLANPTQIRSWYHGPAADPYAEFGRTLAKQVNAVFAINGDYFRGLDREGCLVRQGKKGNFLRCDTGVYDILLIDDKGDLHILKNAMEADIAAFEGTIINAFTFGPGLVIDGERQTGFKDTGNGAFEKAQRMCLAQVGELEYLCICCEGPEDPGSVGMTMEEFAAFVATFEGVRNAYNLDGGSSTTMVFRVKNDSGKLAYKKINSPQNPKERQICDIVYFVSAYAPD